jgi:ribosomal protein S27AE
MRKSEVKRTRHTCTRCGKKREDRFMIAEKDYNNGWYYHCGDCDEENRNYGHPNRIRHSYDC